MTATLDPSVRLEALNARLAELNEQRDQALREIAPAGYGDDADRATNVDAHVRLGVLHERIAAIEAQLANGLPAPAATSAGAVIGDLVTVDLGDGPESFLLGDVDSAGSGVDVITPESPLGKALLGATAGTTVDYTGGNRRRLTATLVSVER